jgi:Ca2+-transporting ATPase
MHIIFMELIMGPTCSIIYENEPMESDTMSQKPRPFANTFFSWSELATSVTQGLVITAGTLVAYQFAVMNGADENTTRSMVFNTLIASNIFLTLVNRSFVFSIFTTIQYKNNLVPLIIGITVAITASLLYIKPLANFFSFSALSITQLSISIALGFVSVIWYEIVKWIHRMNIQKK